MAMTKLGTGGAERTPILANYKFKKANPEYKEKLLQKGQRFTGVFVTTFKRDVKTEDGVFTFISHLFDTKEEGKITIDGCQVLNNEMAKLPRNTPIDITYLGKGKAKTPGKKPPYLFDISADLEARAEAQAKKAGVEAAKESNDEVDESEEEFDNEVPF